MPRSAHTDLPVVRALGPGAGSPQLPRPELRSEGRARGARRQSRLDRACGRGTPGLPPRVGATTASRGRRVRSVYESRCVTRMPLTCKPTLSAPAAWAAESSRCPHRGQGQQRPAEDSPPGPSVPDSRSAGGTRAATPPAPLVLVSKHTRPATQGHPLSEEATVARVSSNDPSGTVPGSHVPPLRGAGRRSGAGRAHVPLEEDRTPRTAGAHFP